VDIFATQGVQKIFNHKSFFYFFGHLWEVEFTYRYFFAFKFTLRSQQSDTDNDTGGKFAAGVVETGDKFPLVSLTPAANLPPLSLTPVANLPSVSTTQAKLVAKFATGVFDTGGAP
jgi:hypothetical protein